MLKKGVFHSKHTNLKDPNPIKPIYNDSEMKLRYQNRVALFYKKLKILKQAIQDTEPFQMEIKMKPLVESTLASYMSCSIDELGQEKFEVIVLDDKQKITGQKAKSILYQEFPKEFLKCGYFIPCGKMEFYPSQRVSKERLGNYR
jgi:hypothetical protein